MKRRLRNGLAGLVWLIAAAMTIALWARNGPERGALPAVVEAPRHQVGAVEAGRLTALLVRPGDAVVAGQALARLDSTDLDTELDVAQAYLDELLAEVESEASALTAELRRERLEVAADLARARAALADARGQLAAGEAELEALSTQLRRLDGALQDGLARADDLGDLHARRQRLAREARHAPEAIRAWRDLTRQIGDALDTLDDDALTARLAPLRARVETQTRRVRQLLELRERRTLRSPASGHVSMVLRAVGDALRPGDPVVVIVPRAPSAVTAFAPEEAARRLTPGMTVEVRARDRTLDQTALGVVQRLGPEIIELPPRLWLAPDRPRFGRPIHITLKEGAPFLASEAVSVVPTDAPGGAQAAPSPADGPPLMTVPEALARRSRLEPSGAVWLAERGRLLVVSDDTGHEGADEHRPWVFTATAGGTFDPAPLPIDGVDRISDLEAVTRAPDGTLYLAASQSLSKRGRRPDKRQWLLRARLDGERLVATGKIRLYAALVAGLSAEALAELGVGPALDIEGIAWRDGDLLVGLKAPSDAAGRAVVWRLADVDALLDRGGVDPAQRDAAVTRFAAIALPTGSTGAPGGISDLLLEGDRLYLLSTWADGPPCGAAWRLDLPPDGREPVRLADWDGYKPEALARTGDGGLVVLFDTGDDPPRLARLTER